MKQKTIQEKLAALTKYKTGDTGEAIKPLLEPFRELYTLIKSPYPGGRYCEDAYDIIHGMDSCNTIWRDLLYYLDSIASPKITETSLLANVQSLASYNYTPLYLKMRVATAVITWSGSTPERRDRVKSLFVACFEKLPALLSCLRNGVNQVDRRLLNPTGADLKQRPTDRGVLSRIIERDLKEYTDPRLFGLELEIENSAIENDNDRFLSASAALGDLQERCAIVGDGSLRSGAEILFGPRPRTTWLDQKGEIKTFLERLKKRGFTSWESGRCGLHIHINRACLSPQAEGRFDRLVQKIAAPWLMRLSGRTIGEGGRNGDAYYYCKFGSVTKADKYRAINFKHDKTLELRFFRGSLDYPRFMANIEVAALLVDYVRSCKRASERSFNEFLVQNLKSYPFAYYKYRDIERLTIPAPVVRSRRTNEVLPQIRSFNNSGI